MINLTLPGADAPYATLIATGEKLADIDEQIIVDLYKTCGAVLLRGFLVNMSEFRRFTTTYCPTSVFNESPDREVLDARLSIQSVNGGRDAFPLHPELSREPWKPDACFFWCIAPPTHGGETTVCDGVEIVKALSPETRNTLLSRRLVYAQPATPEVCEFWLGSSTPDDATLRSPPPHCPYSFTRIDGRIVRMFSRPALHKPMFSDEPAFGNFLLFARYHNGRVGFPRFDTGAVVPDEMLAEIRAAGDNLSAPIAWRPNDVIMIDNTRFMHGRNAILDVGERRIASYFGYLKFAVPDPEEPPAAIWRQSVFRPPLRGRRGGVAT
jgi:alpha-ketoglutarate-dependent taurine dioxygenase